MQSRQFTVRNPWGVHLRPAYVLANHMRGFESKTDIVLDSGRYNAKSVLKILAACICPGNLIAMEISGPDEKEAMEEASRLFEVELEEK